MKNIYIAYTPYHLLLASGLATLNKTLDKKYLIIIPVYSDVEVFHKCLTEWSNNPFSKIIMVKAIYNVGSMIQRVNITRENIKHLIKFFRDEVNERCEVFVFSDQYPVSQIIIHLNYVAGGSNTYVEDGSAAYASHITPNIPFYKRFIYRFAYGMWYRDVHILGTYNHIDNVMAFQPELARPELKCKNIIKMPEDVLNILKNTGFISILLKNYELKQENIYAKYILVVPNSEILNETLLNTYLTLVEYLVTHLGEGYAKYHPRELNGDYLGLRNYSHIKLISRFLPLEAVFAVLQDEKEPKIVIGDFSTSLLTAKHLLKDTYVISIMKLIGLVDTNIENAFKQIGVLLPSNIEDLRSWLMKIENEDIQLKDFGSLQI